MSQLSKIFLFIILLILSTSAVIPATSQPTTAKFQMCWKRTYTMKLGSNPKCLTNEENIGGLCYSYCPWGYTKFGQTETECRENCPTFSKDNGDGTCTIQEKYSNYPFAPLNSSQSVTTTFNRCISINGDGNCQIRGSLVYGVCARYYSTTDGATCTYNGDCLNMDNTDSRLVCRKKNSIPIKAAVPSCGANEVLYFGSCYKQCQSGFLQIGPLCCQSPADGWLDKGFASVSSNDYSTLGPLTRLGIKAAEAAIIGQKALNDVRNNATLFSSRLSAVKANFKVIKDKYLPFASQVSFFANGNSRLPQTINLYKSMNFAFTLNNTENLTLDEYVWNVAVLAHLLNPIGVYNDYFLSGYAYCNPTSPIPVDASPPAQLAQQTLLKAVQTVQTVQSTQAADASARSPIDWITGWVPGTVDPTPDCALTYLDSL